MSPGRRGEAGGTSPHQHRQEGSSIRCVALGQHFNHPHQAHGGLTGELPAVEQGQRLERHVLERRDVTWWGGEVRWETREGAPHKDREEGSSVALEQHCFTPFIPYIARERRTGEPSAVPQVEVSEQHALQRRDVTYRACGVG